MPNLPFMPWYPADHKAKTGHLTLEEQGAYRCLIDELWLADGQLAFDTGRLARRLNISKKRFERIWNLIGEFFRLENGEIRHSRVDAELEKARDLVEKRSAAGYKGAKKKYEKDKKNSARYLANARQTHSNPEPEPEPEGSGRTLKGSTKNLNSTVVDALDRLRDVSGSKNSLGEIEKLSGAISHAADGMLFVTSRFLFDRCSQSLSRELKAANIELVYDHGKEALTEEQGPKLTAIEGGRTRSR